MNDQIMETNKISVIVPVFRVEKYLSKCVDSILGQTYKNLEIILVDDGSDDGCPSLCDSYAKKDNRVRVIHRENGGLSAARNSGIAAATGDYIALIDSDDYIGCNMFKHLMEQIISYDADIALCDYQYVNENGNSIDTNAFYDNCDVLALDGREAQFLMYESYRKRVTFTVAWNKIYKKKLFDGITYPEGRIHEDESRTHELLYKAKKIVYIAAPYYYYLQRNDSIVGANLSIKKLQLIDAYVDKLSFYRKNLEYELWQKEAVHSMHMMCYLQNMFMEAKIMIDIKKQQQMKAFIKELKNARKIEGLSKQLLVEIIMFIFGYDLYYGIWKIKKK